MMVRTLANLLFAIIVIAPGAAWPQDFPSKLVRIISPYPTGLAPDVAIRVLADAMSKSWNQPVIVEARPGANGFIAFGAAKKADPDGYTILMSGQPHLAVAPKLFKKVPYDPEQDFAPISMLYRAHLFIAVAAGAPYKSIKDLVAAARANPGKLNYSSPYIGSPPHMSAALLAHLTGMKMVHVAYKEASQVYNSVGTGDVHLALGTIGSLIPVINAGRVRLLAVGSASRLPSHPEVPTVVESGGPAGYVADFWNAITAPRGTPPAVIQRLNAGVAGALRQKDVQERFQKLGFEPVSSTPEVLAELIRSELKVYGDLISRTGITAE
jgi:tripartite-type tricarboxylate transporter receptor subunit TctC